MNGLIYNSKINKYEIIELEIPEPLNNQVRLKVLACGLCGTDLMIKELISNDIQRVLGHEIVGIVDKIGDGVNDKFKIGMMVGCGWIASTCNKCSNCLNNKTVNCKYQLNCGKDFNGGFAQYTIIPEEGLIIIPDGMDPIETAPLICAGNTIFNAVRSNNIKHGSLVAVQGIGGLGHLGIQILNKMGFEVIAMSSGNEKRSVAMELGAHHYIDMSKNDIINQVQQIGSLQAIICTSYDSKQMNDLLNCLDGGGKLLLTAFCENFKVSVYDIIANSLNVTGVVCGDSSACLDSLKFSKLNNIKPMVQIIDLNQLPNIINNNHNSRFRYVVSFLN